MKKIVIVFTLVLALFLSACSNTGANPSVEPVTQEVVLDEQPLIHNNYCTVTMTSVNPGSIRGYEMNLEIENKSEDHNMSVEMVGASINGIMLDPFWGCEVTAGETAAETVTWYSADLKRLNITYVTDIQFELIVYDADDESIEHYAEKKCQVMPLGADAVQIDEYILGKNDIVLFDNDFCTMIVTGFNPNGDWGYTMQVYLLNKTNKSILFAMDQVSLNGLMCDPYWSEEVAPGKSSYSEVWWTKDAFTVNKIVKVLDIHGKIQVYYADNYDAILATERFEIVPF